MIECKNITKVYQSGAKGNEIVTQALKEISFTVEDGEFVAIMGPSGSGKSTLMHILGCLDNPTSGEYVLDGKNVASLSDNELAKIRREKIGFVFQSFNLLPRTSVLRNVALPLIYAGKSSVEREEKAIQALQASAFPEKFWNHLSNQLSGGMMQRVAIARALVNDPKLILADEPTGNLDTKTGEIVIDTLQRLHGEHGRTIVLITHEQYVAEHAQRIIRLRDGVIIENSKVEHRRFVTNGHQQV